MKKPEQMTPLYWGVFATGGTLAALLLVPLIVVLGVLLPLGVLGDAATLRENAVGLIQHPLIYLLIAGALFTFLWHTLHRFYYVLHDFHIAVGYGFRASLYALAVAALLGTLAYGWV